MNFIILIVLFGAMMWFMQRNQKKAANKRQEQLNSMQPGSEIVTIGGLHGILSSVDTDKGTIELDAEGVILTFDRSAVKTVKPVATSDALDDVISDAKAVTTTESTDDSKTPDSPFE